MEKQILKILENLSRKLNIVLTKKFSEKKKKFSIHATQEDLYHDLIMFYLETKDVSKAESLTIQKYLDLLKSIAIERSWGNEAELEIFIYGEKEVDKN